MIPLRSTLAPFSRVILHFDGDSFFSSVEQVMNPKLRGKPIVTGGERGAITSASIEAKRMGVSRGLSFREAKKICPELIVVPGNYTAYSIFAQRMYNLIREFTPYVEEYSIDECFAEITGLDEVLHMPYEHIALMIKKKLETSLGVTFGVGMGPNKVIAKIASKYRKPAGFTVITPENIKDFLAYTSIGKIWGIGRSSSVSLGSLGLNTALDFAEKDLQWIEYYKISKPYREIWRELQGYFIKNLNLEYEAPGSIIKSRTFSPPSTDRDYIFAQLSKNIESACSKARRHKMRARYIHFYLKTQEFTYHGKEVPLPIAVETPIEILQYIRPFFDKVHRKKVLYRATGISLNGLVPRNDAPKDLFGDSEASDRLSDVFRAVDRMDRKFGAHTVVLGSSLKAYGDRERSHKSLDIPFLGKAR